MYPVDADSCLLELSRYVVLNPMPAGMELSRRSKITRTVTVKKSEDTWLRSVLPNFLHSSLARITGLGHGTLLLQLATTPSLPLAKTLH